MSHSKYLIINISKNEHNYNSIGMFALRGQQFLSVVFTDAALAPRIMLDT